MREREVFFKDLCQKKDKEYQDLVYVQTQGIEECQRLRGEVVEREQAIATLQSELELVRSEILDKNIAIAKLQTELEAGEVKQLNLFPPELTPTPTPEPNPVKLVIDSEPGKVKPESTLEPKSKAKAKSKAKTNPFPEGSLSTMELIAHINQKSPGDNIEYSDLNDCLTLKNGKPKSDKLPGYKEKYGFEFLGKIAGQRRFRLI